jgi:rhodanese-related sulfurtransferase
MHRLAALFTGVTLALTLGACERTTRDTDIKFISVTEAKTLFNRVQRGETAAAIFLDPRPAAEFAAGHIPGARNLTLANVKPTAKVDPRLQQFSNLVVYANNPASATARGLTKRLIAVGYGDVRCFAEGLEKWKERGYPVEESPGQPAMVPFEATPSSPR